MGQLLIFSLGAFFGIWATCFAVGFAWFYLIGKKKDQFPSEEDWHNQRAWALGFAFLPLFIAIYFFFQLFRHLVIGRFWK